MSTTPTQPLSTTPSPPPAICMFRLYKKGGHICGKTGGAACNHGGRGRGYQTILNQLIGDNVEWDWRFLMRAERTDDVAPALEYVFCKTELISHARDLGLRTTQKQTPSHYICSFYFKLTALSHRPAFLDALVRLQAAVRRLLAQCAARLQGPWVAAGTAPINTEDAFTLGPIDDIPNNHRFSYTTDDGRVYAFSAPELNRYMASYKAINPFTREPIPEEAQKRLAKMMSSMPASIRHPITVWRSPRDAFVDVLHAYECYGFYTRLEWFSELSGDDIYAIFEIMSVDRHVPSHLFNLEKLDDAVAAETEPNEVRENLLYALATTMRTVIRYSFATQFHTICRLFLTLTDVNPEMRGNIPNWVVAGAQA